jgi:hypothetical protein
MNEQRQNTIINLIKAFISKRRTKRTTTVNPIGLTIFYANLIKLNEGL